MNASKFFPFFSCAFCIFASFNALAYQPKTELLFSTGWRKDQVKQSTAKHIPETAPPNFFDHVGANNINIWELGVSGSWALPAWWDGYYFSCDTWWLQQFYLRGYAFWGDTCNGNWQEEFNDIPAITPVKIENGRISKGRTRDYLIAFGWLYPFCGNCVNIGIGPVGGYSFDYIKWKIHDLRNPDGSPNTNPDARHGEQLRSSFQGPFAGIDLCLEWNCFWLASGYEYHWVTTWRGAKEYPFVALFAGNIPDSRHADSGFGNVIYLNAGLIVCDGWELGLGFKFRHFKSDNGSVRLTRGFTFPANEFESAQGQWTSYGFQIDVGYYF